MERSVVDAAIRRQGVLESERKTFEAHWREASELVLPEFSTFDESERTPGEKKNAKIWNDKAQLALPKFAAIINSMNTPDNQVWHKLRPSAGVELDEGGPVAEWFEEVNRTLATYRDAPGSNWRHAKHEAYLGYGAHGNFAIYQDRGPGAPLQYTCCPLKQVYWSESAFGRVRPVHRRMTMTNEQIVEAAKAGKFNRDMVPSRIYEQAVSVPTGKQVILHVVEDNPDRDPSREDDAGMLYRSYYVLMSEKAVIQSGGMNRWPWLIGRYLKAPGESYGRGPAMQALPSIKTLQDASRATIKAWHWAVDPPFITVDDALSRPPSMRPGAINPGMMSEDGRALIQPMMNGARFDIDEVMTQRLSSSVDDAFLVALFLLAVENPNMTATEVLERVRQQGLLLAPAAGRLQSEFLGPEVEGAFALLAEQGLLPPAPPEIMDFGARYEVEYVSPLATAARAEEALVVMRTFEQVAALAQMKPEIMDRFDADEAFKVIARANGLPGTVIADDQVVQGLREQRAQQQQMQMMLANAQPVAGAVKDVVDAEAAATAA